MFFLKFIDGDINKYKTFSFKCSRKIKYIIQFLRSILIHIFQYFFHVKGNFNRVRTNQLPEEILQVLIP